MPPQVTHAATSSFGDYTASTLLDDPPSGVDLHALAREDSWISPDDCAQIYDLAFNEAGGEAALSTARDLSEKLQTMLSHQGVVTQLDAWESQSLQSMLRKLGDGTAVRNFGISRLNEFVESVKVSSKIDCSIEIADVKAWSRASVKTCIKYGMNCSRLVDMNRATVICNNIADMYSVIGKLFAAWGPRDGVECESVRILEFEDHYLHPMAENYRHCQLIVSLAGCCWEVQFNTAPLVRAKHEAGHKLYKTTRFVREMLLFTAMRADLQALEDMLAYPGVSSVADPDAVCDKNKLTALHHASFNGQLEIVNILCDGKKVSKPANVWALDSTPGWGSNPGRALPLNYAMMMQHWAVAKQLVTYMQERLHVVRQPEANSEICERLARACFVAIDNFDTVPDLLLPLLQLWTSAGGASLVGLDPVTYAFRMKAAPVLSAFLHSDHMQPWITDSDGCLPLERALQLGLVQLAEAIIAKMQEKMPLRPTAESAWSLVRCQDEGIASGGVIKELLQHVGPKLQRRIFTSRTIGSKCVVYQHDALSLQQMEAVNLPDRSIATCLVVSSDILYVGTDSGFILRWRLSDMRNLEEMEPLKDPSKPISDARAHSQSVTGLLLWPPLDPVPRYLHSASRMDVKVWAFSDVHFSARIVCQIPFGDDVVAVARLDLAILCVGVGSNQIFRCDTSQDLSSSVGGTVVGKQRISDATITRSESVETLLECGGKLLSGGSEIRCWDRQGQHLGVWKGHSKNCRVIGLCMDRGHSDSKNAYVVSVAVLEADGTGPMHVRIRRGNRGETYRGPSEFIVWSTAGDILWTSKPLVGCLCGDVWAWKDVLVTGRVSNSMQVWDARDGTLLTELPSDAGVLTSLAVTSQTLEDVPPTACPDSLPSLQRRLSESSSLREAFKRCDRDGDDRLTKDELTSVFLKCMERADVSRRFAEVLFECVDLNDDGTVSVEEFVEFVTLKGSSLQPQDFLALGSTPAIKVIEISEDAVGVAEPPRRRTPSPRVRSARDEAMERSRTAPLQPHHAHLRRGGSRSASPRPRSPAAAAR